MRAIQRRLRVGLAITVGAAGLNASVSGEKSGGSNLPKKPALSVASLSGLNAIQGETMRSGDIGRMNLLCAQGLSGSEDLDINGSLTVLDEMSARVRTETARHYYRFQQKPSEFENSEGFFRMIMLAVVLAEDFRVQYNPGKKVTADEARIGDGFFKDAHDVFLHGVLGSKRQGTCSSLPVLQVAVGRRLGYPLKLVTTKGHLFVRWEDGPEPIPLPLRGGEGVRRTGEGRVRERFNVEAAGNGVNRFSDDYYRHWPFEVSQEEMQAEGYLKSLTPAEELAVFLSIRGMCCHEAGRYADAAESFREAARLAPGCRSYRLMQEQVEQKARASGKPVVANTKKGEQHP